MTKRNRQIALISVFAVMVLVAVIIVQLSSNTGLFSGETRLAIYESPMTQKAYENTAVTERGVATDVVEKVAINLGYPKESVSLVQEAFTTCYKKSPAPSDTYKCVDAVMVEYPAKQDVAYQSNFAGCLHKGETSETCMKAELSTVNTKEVFSLYENCKSSNDTTIGVLNCVDTTISTGKASGVVLSKEGALVPDYATFEKLLDTTTITKTDLSPSFSEAEYLANPITFNQTVAPTITEDLEIVCNETNANHAFGDQLCVDYSDEGGESYAFLTCDSNLADANVPAGWVCDAASRTWSEYVEEVCDQSHYGDTNSQGQVCVEDWGSYYWATCNDNISESAGATGYICTAQNWQECNGYNHGKQYRIINTSDDVVCDVNTGKWEVCNSTKANTPVGVDNNGVATYLCSEEEIIVENLSGQFVTEMDYNWETCTATSAVKLSQNLLCENNKWNKCDTLGEISADKKYFCDNYTGVNGWGNCFEMRENQGIAYDELLTRTVNGINYNCGYNEATNQNNVWWLANNPL